MWSGVAIYEAVKKGKDFVFAGFNRAGRKIDNIKQKDVIGKSILKVFPGVKEFGLFDVLKRVWETGEPEHFPVKLYKDNRTSGWRNNYIFKLPSGKVVAIYEDITQRKQSEERLKASERRFREAVMNAPLPVMIHREDGEIISINEVWTEITGYTKEDIPNINTWVRKAFGKKKKIVKKNIENLYEMDKRVDEGEYEIKTKDGSKRIWHFSSSPMGKTSGGEKLFVRMALDVTEEKKRKEVYKNLINGMNDTAFVIGFNEKFVDVNERAVEVLGYTYEELLNMGPTDIDPNLSSEDISLLINGMQTDEKQVFPTEHKTRDGRVIPVEISSSRIMYNGEPHVLSVARDISKRKEAEEALRKSEEEYRAVFENTGTATIMVEQNKIISLANKKFEKLSGFSKDKIEGKKYWMDFVAEEDVERMKQYHETRRKSPSDAPKEYDFKFIGKDKKIKDILLYVDMIPGTEKSIASLLDVTERKKALEALKESEERFQTVIENLPHGVMLHDFEGKFRMVNKASHNLTGYTEEELLNMRVGDLDPESITRDDREKFWLKLLKK